MEKDTNKVVTDGEPTIQTMRRPSIKLATKPHIVLCVPCGDKEVAEVFHCPEEHSGCGREWIGPARRHPYLVSVHWTIAHMNLMLPLNSTAAYLIEGGRLAGEARQIMTKKALRIDPKYILYWDDDTLPEELDLYKLHVFMETHPAAGAITGVYTTREDPPEPLVYKEHGIGAYWDLPMGPGAKPQPIFGCGAGFLLVRADAVRDTINKINNDGQLVGTPDEVPIWADERTLPGKGSIDDGTKRKVMWGHDIRFCKLLNENGWPVYAHGAVQCTHVDIATDKKYRVPDDAPGMVKQREINDAKQDPKTAANNGRGVQKPKVPAKGRNTKKGRVRVSQSRPRKGATK